ncbi:hypothetical protein KC365_g17570 [Hortaea werneckii]|nr:hypothetical protein KC339_g18362 [Hortaea werneckii]KAI7205680.1 hypothetical protein KC365_g17570 [Hortaea werneckii]
MKPRRSPTRRARTQKKQDFSNASIHEPLDDPEKGPIAAEQEQEDHDRNIVDWDGPDDPSNPVNWSPTRKWTNIAVLSALTLLTPLASSMLAPGVPELMRTFPLQQREHRHLRRVRFILYTVAYALSASMDMLIGSRFVAGIWDIAPITNGGGTIADLMKPEQRGGAMVIWAMGFLAQAEGWRWIFWVIAIAIGVMHDRGLRKETGNLHLRSKLDKKLPAHELFLRAIVRPTKLLFRSPICALMSLYMAFVYAILYLLFDPLHLRIRRPLRSLSRAPSGSCTSSLARKHNDGKVKPEYRLPMLIYAGPNIPAGLFLYGWTAQYHIQWAVPLLGTLFVGIRLIAAFMCINTYLVDTFTIYAASAMAANTVLRSLFGATFPLFGLSMYDTLGLGWGNSLLAFIALAMCPIPLLFYWYGEKFRTHPRFQIQL